jgi:hypothetical protein
MSTEEFRQSLVAAGIINSGGKLEKKYKGSTNHKSATDEQGPTTDGQTGT